MQVMLHCFADAVAQGGRIKGWAFHSDANRQWTYLFRADLSEVMLILSEVSRFINCGLTCKNNLRQ